MQVVLTILFFLFVGAMILGVLLVLAGVVGVIIALFKRISTKNTYKHQQELERVASKLILAGGALFFISVPTCFLVVATTL